MSVAPDHPTTDDPTDSDDINDSNDGNDGSAEHVVVSADLTAPVVAHRAMRRDVRRLARLTDGLAAGTERFPTRRVLAYAEWVERVCEEIGHDHEAEETLVWPLVARHAGEAIDLSGLRDDHRALAGLLGEVRRGARAVVAALMVRPAEVATVEDFARIRTLAARLTELADLLEEHQDETAREVGELVTRVVPRADFLAAAATLRAGRPDPVFTAVRALDVATREEAAILRGRALGRLSRRASTVALRRRERLLFGRD